MPQKPSHRVAIVSDQPIFLRGLAALIAAQPGVQLVGQARTAEEAVELCGMAHPDLILLHLDQADDQGRGAVDHISEGWPNAKIVLLLPGADEADFAGGEARKPGRYYLSRDVNEEEFHQALQKVCEDPRPDPALRAPAQATFAHQPAELMEGDAEEPVDLGTRPHIPRGQDVLTRELVMAGRIQADILPEVAPSIPGWDIVARLIPARETSGDFYDFIPLNERKLGIVIADVTDKGMGAALFMALSSTLIRTYATRFPTLPAVTLSEVNKRILSDTRGDMFVTAVFGILEPSTGRYIYANAGHPPGYLICSQKGRVAIETLRTTGMSLGVSEQAQWRQKMIKMAPGDLLILYTDGITEAQNSRGEFFEADRLLDAALANVGRSAREVQEALLQAVHTFEGGTRRQDDIAIIVIRREK